MLTRSKTQKAGGRKSSKPRESLQESGEFCPGSRNSSQSLTYSEEVPIRDFLGLHSDSFQRCHSVPVEVYKADRLHNDHHPSSDEHNTLASNQERDVDDDQDCEATSATGQ